MHFLPAEPPRRSVSQPCRVPTQRSGRDRAVGWLWGCCVCRGCHRPTCIDMSGVVPQPQRSARLRTRVRAHQRCSGCVFPGGQGLSCRRTGPMLGVSPERSRRSAHRTPCQRHGPGRSSRLPTGSPAQPARVWIPRLPQAPVVCSRLGGARFPEPALGPPQQPRSALDNQPSCLP